MNKKQPLVSVVIATKNRADYLTESMNSVLNQTFRDFELIIVDDGSTDNTQEVVEAIQDPRVIYTRTPDGRSGISAARNHGAEISSGTWTAVHDDDDLMLPWRLEQQMKLVKADDDFIFGTFINFDDATGDLQFHHGRNFNFGSALQTGFAPGHSTWLIRTELLRDFGYDEGLESAVDNNLAFRLLRSGIEAKHSGVVCLLRRVHSGRITDTGSGNQKYTAKLNLEFLKSGINSKSRQKLWQEARYSWGPTDKHNWETRFLPYLPDHLVSRGGWAFKPAAVSEDELRYSFEVRPLEGAKWNDIYRYSHDGFCMGEATARYSEAPRFEALVDHNCTPDFDSDTCARLSYNLSRAESHGRYFFIALGDLAFQKYRRIYQFARLYEFDVMGEKKMVSVLSTNDLASFEPILAAYDAGSIEGSFKLLVKPENSQDLSED